MATTADIVAIGSGHNGLVAAAYLAVAGKSVVVLERNHWFGGGVVTRELTVPGFRHDQHSMAHIFIQGNPLLLDDELKLKARYGLRYLFPDPPMMSVFEDGTTLALYRDRERSCAQIAQFSDRDARAYRQVAEQAQQWMPMLSASLFTAPTPLGASYALLDQSREGRELLRTMSMSIHDVLCERFESDKVRTHFARIAGENLVSPDEKATGIGVFVFLGFLEKYGFGVPVGGSGALTAALIACIEEHGGQVLADTSVQQVEVAGGRATGVVTADGRTFKARDAVIGAIHPHLLGAMIEGLDPRVRREAEATQFSETACLTVHAALNEPLHFKAGERVRAVMIELLPNSYEELRRSFDDLRYGQLSGQPLVGMGSLTMFDPARAPPGKATAHIWDYVPYHRADGRSWDETKASYAQRVLDQVARYVDNIGPRNLIAYHCDSPVDMERTSASFMHGDLHGIATTSYQSGSHRPTPDLGQYAVPGVERFYLVGPFQHPGGGVFGAGRATAMKMFEDLKLNFARTRA
ncbi:MAG TPA: NAD(P)/FAD-dependent oxidoreductase [Steroidobacteraceae bacterium]|nr:NAD(P)/FAD-dependent oxidoreductase [Steroidobacteraceae bacterium]